jgi:hypothetical protein
MVTRILNRRKLRKPAEAVQQPETPAVNVTAEVVTPRKKARAKTAGSPVRKPRAKKPPPRVRARWGVFDGAMKQVAIFDYNQRPEADAKLADLLTKRKGSYFLQIIKESIPEPAVSESPG